MDKYDSNMSRNNEVRMGEESKGDLTMRNKMNPSLLNPPTSSENETEIIDSLPGAASIISEAKLSSAT